jgi:hypothetical protein
MSDGPFLDTNDPDAPQRQLLRDEQQRAAALRAREEQQREQEHRKARIKEEHGPRIAKDIEARIDTHLDGSERVRDLAAEFVAKELAARNIGFEQARDRSRLYDKAIGEASKIEEAERPRREAAEREAEKQVREQKEREAKELEKQESAKREPIPNTMQRFNAILAESKAQKAQTNAANIERAGQLADNRPNYARHDVLKNPQEPSIAKGSSLLEKDAQPTPRGEISEAKAEKLAKMFDKPSSDKYFDPTHDPSNALNYSNGRGGRGGR